jgi:hypothetical protein
MKISIKVDTEAIRRNGQKAKGMQPRDYEPAIIVGFYPNGELTSEITVHQVHIEGPCQIIQNDSKPGFTGKDGRSARIWIETESPVSIHPPEHNHDPAKL